MADGAADALKRKSSLSESESLDSDDTGEGRLVRWVSITVEVDDDVAVGACQVEFDLGEGGAHAAAAAHQRLRRRQRARRLRSRSMRRGVNAVGVTLPPVPPAQRTRDRQWAGWCR